MLLTVRRSDENLPDLAALVEPLLIVRRVVREQLGILHRRLLAIVRDDDVCRRLMTVPGVGPVVALTYRVTVDVPAQAWAIKIARHRGMKKAIVALARRLAVIMHRIWVDGTEFRWTREVAAA
jgi:transposase